MELPELVILLHFKWGKKQTFEHFEALQSPTHFPTPIPPNHKQSLPWEKFCHLENSIFSKSHTDNNKWIISIYKTLGGPKNQKSATPFSFLSQNNPEKCLFDPCFKDPDSE